MNIFGFTTWGWAKIGGEDVRIWKYSGEHLKGVGNVEVDGPLYVATEDRDLLLLLSAALRDYHQDTP